MGLSCVFYNHCLLDCNLIFIISSSSAFFFDYLLMCLFYLLMCWFYDIIIKTISLTLTSSSAGFGYCTWDTILGSADPDQYWSILRQHWGALYHKVFGWHAFYGDGEVPWWSSFNNTENCGSTMILIMSTCRRRKHNDHYKFDNVSKPENK